jgi:hypothetical protein
MRRSTTSYFGAVITTEDGDARIMCMAQVGDSVSVHFFNVDTSLDEIETGFLLNEKVAFGEELRRFGLAVLMLDEPPGDLREEIELKLREVYGSEAAIVVRPVESPSLVSLYT